MAKRKNPPQNKAAIAARFNKRIDELVASGVDPSLLPDKINDVSVFTHRELRQVASAAAKKNSEGFYKSGKVQLPKIRQSYQKAMLNIINERRAKRKKAAGMEKVKVAGAETGLRRAEMGDIRVKTFEPLKTDRTFRSQRDEDYFIKSLPKMITAESDKRFVDNLIVSLKKTFGDKANRLCAMLLKADPQKVLKAYYHEELFDIQTVYEIDNDKEDNYIEILKQALIDVGVEDAYYTKARKAYIDEIVSASVAEEQEDVLAHMFPDWEPAKTRRKK